MIAYLKGKIIKKTDKGIILNTGNIGYNVYVGKSIHLELKENSEVELFIHHHIREDMSDLYGFTNYGDLNFFIKLININGIGPKAALEILNFSQEKIKNAILNEDEVFICKVPGIGKKTAKRLILEMKDKVSELDLMERSYLKISEETHNEAIDALMKLGYQKHEIMKTIKDLPENHTETEQIITYFLKIQSL